MTRCDTRRTFFSKADAPNLPIDKLRGEKPTSRQIITLIHTVMGERVVSVNSLSRSTFHHIFLVTTENHRWIVRTRASMMVRALEFLVDRWVNETLKERMLPWLAVHVVDASRTIVPFDYEITDVASGKWLYTWIKTTRSWRSVLEDFGCFVGRLHTIPTTGFGLLDPLARGVNDSWAEYMLQNVETHIEFLRHHGIITTTTGLEIRHVLDCISIFSVKPFLLHGDLANHNAFTDGKRVTALIDWEDAVSGDPVFDVAYYQTGCFGHEEWFDAFVKGYKKERRLPVDFNKRLWVYALRISLAKAMGRIRFPSSSGRQLPDMKARIDFALSQCFQTRGIIS